MNAESLLQSLINDASRNSPPQGAQDNQDNVQDHMKRARDEEVRQQEQEKREQQRRAKEKERQEEVRREQQRKAKEERERKAAAARAEEARAKAQEAHEAKLRQGWTRMSQRFDKDASNLWAKIDALDEILNDLDKADKVNEHRRGICHDSSGIFGMSKPIPGCPGISIEQEYSERTLLRKAVIKQSDTYWTELAALEARRESAWHRMDLLQTGWDPLSATRASYYRDKAERDRRMRDRKAAMREKEEARELERTANIATVNNRNNTGHTCSIPSVFGSTPVSAFSTFGTASQNSASTSSPGSGLFGTAPAPAFSTFGAATQANTSGSGTGFGLFGGTPAPERAPGSAIFGTPLKSSNFASKPRSHTFSSTPASAFSFNAAKSSTSTSNPAHGLFGSATAPSQGSNASGTTSTSRTSTTTSKPAPGIFGSTSASSSFGTPSQRSTSTSNPASIFSGRGFSFSDPQAASTHSPTPSIINRPSPGNLFDSNSSAPRCAPRSSGSSSTHKPTFGSEASTSNKSPQPTIFGSIPGSFAYRERANTFDQTTHSNDFSSSSRPFRSGSETIFRQARQTNNFWPDSDSD
ncbi:uncharacterized protein LY89DRAFT_267739 [Mollisia scopiformis]|uniref:Uncharacterized protein n=1 Tax=Mollisia scopiformis TaxID=149040 RepID=A0A132BDC9_MOLSC|nr:uncharacterized protein LY89DRAFT_267739 [Mollisia scopiformis]KUJ09989.1 hypothetical protein LY89DRAFT_267739 [Mollisia scopiformis]